MTRDELARVLEEAADLPGDAPVVIETEDGRELAVESVDTHQLEVEGVERGHTYLGVAHLRITARPATHAEIAAVYVPADGQDPNRSNLGYA